jgi:hypothetical protein
LLVQLSPLGQQNFLQLGCPASLASSGVANGGRGEDRARGIGRG